MGLEVEGVCCGFRECGRARDCEGEDGEGFNLERHFDEDLATFAQNYVVMPKQVVSLDL